MPLRATNAPHGAWLAYGIGTAAALDVLNVAVPWLVAANIAALAIGHAAGDMKRHCWRSWICVQFAIVAVWAAMLIAVYVARYVARGGAIIDDVGWAWPATRKTIRSIVGPVYLLRISNFIEPGMPRATVPALSLVIATLAAIGVWRLRRRPVVIAVFGAATLMLPVSLGLVSLFVPVLVPRYFLWSAGPFFVLAGVGLEQLFREPPSRVRSAALGAALTVVCLINLAPSLLRLRDEAVLGPRRPRACRARPAGRGRTGQ
jgi:hypothetical protein